MISISGGWDSDILCDIMWRILGNNGHYVFFDTGLEYQATKDHLKYLEEKYKINIEKEKAIMPSRQLAENTDSRCYSLYGLKRTGCAGCPFGKDFEQELEIIKQYEPKLYRVVIKIFGDSYEYTRKYLEFREVA